MRPVAERMRMGREACRRKQLIRPLATMFQLHCCILFCLCSVQLHFLKFGNNKKHSGEAAGRGNFNVPLPVASMGRVQKK